VTLPVRLTSVALQDLALAERWYLDEAPHVLASFEDEIDRTFYRISERPESYPTAESTVRRALVRKFPFSVFYRILPEWIEVVAVLHQSRDPRTWRQRV
jgi:plasmid stabilization system protein ParE